MATSHADRLLGLLRARVPENSPTSYPLPAVGTSVASPERALRPIGVVVVDDHEVVRRGLAAFLDLFPDLVQLGEARDGRSAVDLVSQQAAAGRSPDVVIMDLVMPEMDGLSATTTLKELHPDVKVVVLTSFTDVGRARAAIEAGAAGYVRKDADLQELVTAVRSAYAGEAHIDAAVARALAVSLGVAKASVQVLSAREREVLVHVAAGRSNREIADALFITERTARTHVSNVLRKLGLPSRTQAALWAVRAGLVPPR